jgi:quercetin dioxygenase-like cupin family protein
MPPRRPSKRSAAFSEPNRLEEIKMVFAKSHRQLGRDAWVSCLTALALAASATGVAVFAQTKQSPVASARREVIKQALPGERERDLTLVEVTYPPGAGSPPHLHANGVMAFVVSGSITSKVGDAPEQTYRAGDAWWEPPGAVHHVSRNASATEPATLLAIYIAPRGATPADLMKPLRDAHD